MGISHRSVGIGKGLKHSSQSSGEVNRDMVTKLNEILITINRKHARLNLQKLNPKYTPSAHSQKT